LLNGLRRRQSKSRRRHRRAGQLDSPVFNLFEPAHRRAQTP